MIRIILLIIGIVGFFKEKIAITGKSELRQPKLRLFGVITIVIAALDFMFWSFVLGGMTDSDVYHSFGFFTLIFYAWAPVAMIVTAFMLKQPKTE